MRGGYSMAMMEEPVAAAVLLVDPRRRDRTAYLGLLHCANDQESLERLLGAAMEQLWPFGCQRLLGPVGLSPYLQTGALQDYFNLMPPLHTPYNPPYMPDVMFGVMENLAETRLFHAGVPIQLSPLHANPARLTLFDPDRLSQDLLPLLVEACAVQTDFPPPDAAEAEFLLQWLGILPLCGWLAMIDDQPVGFILLQPDLSTSLARAKGGRNPVWRLWLAWRSQRPTAAGCVLFSSVLPAWRGRGIGSQLWRQALVTAREYGWRSLSVGPLPAQAPAAAFLQAQGATPRQTYRVYTSDM